MIIRATACPAITLSPHYWSPHCHSPNSGCFTFGSSFDLLTQLWFSNHTILDTTAFHSEVSLTMSSKGDRLAGKVAIVTGETILSHIPSMTCNDVSPVVIPRRWVWLRCSNSNPLRFPRMLCSCRRHQRGGRRKDSKRWQSKHACNEGRCDYKIWLGSSAEGGYKSVGPHWYCYKQCWDDVQEQGNKNFRDLFHVVFVGHRIDDTAYLRGDRGRIRSMFSC